MTQLELLPGTPTPPELRLTERQRNALQIIGQHQPIQSDELGAHLHRHGPDTRCQWCTASGREVATALKRKGLAKRIRGVGWVTPTYTDQNSTSRFPTTNEGAKFGEFPPDF